MTIGFELEPIGYVKNDVQDVRFKDWKNLLSCLVIDSRYAKALDGLEEFSHLLVITRLHLPGRVLLKRHPRNRQDLPVVGVFATRSQMRPNRLGLHVVCLMERKKDELLVQGLDTVNGTPLIDIKPYIPEQDVVMSATVPAWVHKLHDL